MPEPRAKAPEGLSKAGKRLWKRLIVSDLEYRPDEILLIEEAARVADTLAELRQRPQDPKTRIECRLQQEQLRKLLRAISWPEENDANMSQWGRQMAQRRWRKSG